MKHDVLIPVLSRRSFLAGTAALCAFVPMFAAAEGGLKGGASDDGEEAPDDALAEIGVTGDGTYESPLFGYQVAWDDSWLAPADDPGESNEDENWDTLRLRWSDTPEARDVAAMISFDGFSTTGMDVSGWLEGMADPAILDKFFSQGVYESAVALVAQDGDLQEVVWQLVNPDDSNDVVTMISAYRTLPGNMMLMASLSVFTQPLLDETLEAMIDGVTIDDEPVLSLLTQSDIEDALAALD